MNNWIVMLMAAGLALQTGCRKNGNGDANTESSDVLARYHFVGSGQLVNNTNAAKLKEIWSLPETGAPGRTDVAEAQPRAQRRCSANRSTRTRTDAAPRCSARCWTTCFGMNPSFSCAARWNIPRNGRLGVHLAGDRSKAWRAAIGDLLQVWKLEPAKTNSVEGVTCLEVTRDGNPGLIRWAEARDWFVLGIAQDRMPAFDGALRRLHSSGRPLEAASNYWLETELDLPKLSRLLNVSPSFGWPSLQLSIIGRGENLRSTGRLTFAQPTTGPLATRQIPTQLINEPLVSFTAAQGVERLLRDVKCVRRSWRRARSQ